MVKRLTCFSLLIFWALLLSCEDVEPAFQYPMTFAKTRIIPKGKWRVFTKKGEVTDKNALRNLVLDDDTATFRYAAENYILKSGSIDLVRIMGPNEGWVRSYQGIMDCNVSAVESGFVLTRIDTTRGTVCGEQFTRHFSYYIGSVMPVVFNEFLGSSTRGGYCFGYSTTQKFVFNGHTGAFYAPYILYAVRTITNEPPIYAGSTYLNNNLAHGFYEHLDQNQSISLMEYQLLFERK